jgi:hypothetical protein
VLGDYLRGVSGWLAERAERTIIVHLSGLASLT